MSLREEVLSKRYLLPGETEEDMWKRVASVVSSAETIPELRDGLEQKYYKIMSEHLFLPNSPTIMNAGTGIGQLSACFVIPVEDSIEGIFDAVKWAAIVNKSGGGTGFSFSRLRPKGDIVGSTSGVASGPISFMSVFDIATEVIKQGGRRRGANMGVLRVDHPDIEDFITCKDDTSRFTNFNISVAITDAFMRAVDQDEHYALINPLTGSCTKTLPARSVFNKIIQSAWKTGEPGVIFIDTINRYNPTPQLGEIEGTNPCGEQPLLPFESCVLGSINLSKFVNKHTIDFVKLKDVVHTAVHFLDNVVDVNNYPLDAIKDATLKTRKIGLGVMGWADMLILLGIRYDSTEAEELAENIMSFITKQARKASAYLASKKGNFIAYNKSIWDNGETLFMRNATVTTIAPTGSISILANCSSGIEPIYSPVYIRRSLDGKEFFEVHPLFKTIAVKRGFFSEDILRKVAEAGSVKDVDGIPDDVKNLFVSAHDIAPTWHVRIQAAFQRHTDNAVSKTINLPKNATIEDVRDAFLLAYKLGCKGVTVYRDGSRDAQVLSTISTKTATAQHSVSTMSRIPRTRPETTVGVTTRIPTGCGKLYVTINRDEYGIIEVFAQMGKAGGCSNSQIEAIGRLISTAIRAGVNVEYVIKQLRGIRCPSPMWHNNRLITSCSDAIAIALQRNLQTSTNTVDREPRDQPPQKHCPECGWLLSIEGGCILCRSCGWTQCV